jgi:hypothetical protein
MRRLAVVVVLALSAACGAPDEGDGEYGSGSPEDETLAQRSGGGDHDTTSGDSDEDDAGDPNDNGDPNDTDWDLSPGDHDDGDVTPADCEPVPPPPPVTCPIVECPEWEPWCDGDCITIRGEHFAHPGQASLVIRFMGDYTADGCAPEEVDVRYRATYVSATEATFIFNAGSAPRGFGEGGGSFNGWIYAANVEPDGTEWTSKPVSVAIRF